MSRIPDAVIEKIKKEVSIKQLIESYGVQLKPVGKDLTGLCILHDDTEPSLLVSEEKGLWNCLGACQTGGDQISFVMAVEKISFRNAVQILRDRYRIASDGSASSNSTPAAVPQFKTEADKQQLLNQVIEFYHKTLKDSPEALAYFEKRKLIEPTMIDHFKLGYSNRTLGYRLPKSGREAAELRAKLQELGFFRPTTGHESFSGSAIIPVIDETGQITEVYGRKITKGLRPGTSLHLYLKGQHKGVFNVQAFEASKEIILCEALLDALSFWCWGFRNVTSSYGINGFTADHLEAFKKYGVHTVLIAYDNDEAGNNAADKLSLKLTAEGFYCKRIRFPWGMDANEFACQSDDPEKDFKQLIQSASGIDEKTKAGEEPRDLQKPAAQNPLLDPEPVHSKALCRSDASIPTEINPDEVLITLADRKWKIRGLSKNLSYDHLKVNIRVSVREKFFIDTLDLYSANLRQAFSKRSAAELEVAEDVIKADLCKVLLKIEELQDKQIKEALEPKNKEVVLTEKEREEALAFLKDPKLLDRILEDIEKCGIIGEETNKLVCYLAAVSRKLENPLAVIIQSSSAAGKTWLMEIILSFAPEEERIKYSAMTGQSLYYLQDKDLRHKILAIVEEEGAEKASYALKILQSEKQLILASVSKNPSTGKMVTYEYKVEGPVMIFLTTTSIEIDEELQNRCLVLTVNESREQTKAIHRMQRERRTLEGQQAQQEKSSILKLHNNAQRLLKPLAVVNPYAPKLTFLDDRTRTRRDHEKYLNLIEAIALLHQYQRAIKRMPKKGSNGGGEVDYIEVQLSDIETANKLAGEVLGHSLDELPPQTRQLLNIIETFVKESCIKFKIKQPDFKFSRRAVREYCNWSNTRLTKHLERLQELEYLILHHGTKGQTFVYELIYEGNGKDGKPFLVGLIDVNKLRAKKNYDTNLTPQKANLTPLNSNLTPPKHPGNTGVTRGLHPRVNSQESINDEPLQTLDLKNGENSFNEAPPVDDLNRNQIVNTIENYDSFLATKLKEFEEKKDSEKPNPIIIPIRPDEPIKPADQIKGNGKE